MSASLFRLCKSIATGKEFALKCLLDSPKARTEVRINVRSIKKSVYWLYVKK